MVPEAWQVKLAAGAAAAAGAWGLRAWRRRLTRDALNPWTWFSMLSWKVRLALFLLAPMWVGSLALGAFLFGAVFSEALAAYALKNAPAPLAKVVSFLHPR